jgi:hypothetical protein
MTVTNHFPTRNSHKRYGQREGAKNTEFRQGLEKFICVIGLNDMEQGAVEAIDLSTFEITIKSKI